MATYVYQVRYEMDRWEGWAVATCDSLETAKRAAQKDHTEDHDLDTPAVLAWESLVSDYGDKATRRWWNAMLNLDRNSASENMYAIHKIKVMTKDDVK